MDDQKTHAELVIIHDIPIEIIQKIFGLVASSEFYDAIGKHQQSSTPFSQVCSLWRRIALGTKEIWTYIHVQTRRLRGIELAISRSHPLPLSVAINPRGDDMHGWYEEAVYRALREVSRIRELFLDLSTASSAGVNEDDYFQNCSDILCSSPAPRLEVFEAVAVFDPDFHLHVFRGQAPPSLRRVAIYNCIPSCPSILFTVPLTSLELSDCQWGLLDALKTIPSLQTLKLSYTLLHPDLFPYFLDGAERVALPSLRRFHILDRLSSIMLFLPLLVIPPNVELELELECSRDAADDIREDAFPRMVASLGQTLSAIFTPAVDSGTSFQHLAVKPVKLSTSKPDHFEIVLSNPIDTGPVSTLSRRVRMAFDLSYGSDDTDDTIPLLFSAVPAIHGVKTLDVRGMGLRFPDVWHSISHFARAISHITVESTSVCGLVMTLGATDVFPRLESLCVKCVLFAGRIVGQDLVTARGLRRDGYARVHMRRDFEGHVLPTEPILDDAPVSINMLLGALKSRAAAGNPIRHLSILESALDNVMVSTLRDCLGTDAVEWDGQTNGRRGRQVHNVVLRDEAVSTSLPIHRSRSIP